MSFCVMPSLLRVRAKAHLFFPSVGTRIICVRAWGNMRNDLALCVREENYKLSFNVFMKVIALDVSFHFPSVPRNFELRRSSYDHNTTRLSCCKTCWKIDFSNFSENSSCFFFDDIIDFLRPIKHVNLLKISEIPGMIKT